MPEQGRAALQGGDWGGFSGERRPPQSAKLKFHYDGGRRKIILIYHENRLEVLYINPSFLINNNLGFETRFLGVVETGAPPKESVNKQMR